MCGWMFMCLWDIFMWPLFEQNRGFFWIAGVHCTLAALATGINLSRKISKNGRQRTDWPMDGTCNTQKSSKYFKVYGMRPTAPFSLDQDHSTLKWSRIADLLWTYSKHVPQAILASMWCLNMSTKSKIHGKTQCKTKFSRFGLYQALFISAELQCPKIRKQNLLHIIYTILYNYNQFT